MSMIKEAVGDTTLLRVSSRKYIEARARKIRVVSRVNVGQVTGLEPPFIEPEPGEEQDPQALPQKDLNAHPFFWKEPVTGGRYQKDPSEIRWVWDPQTGVMNVGTQGRHTAMTPAGVEWDGVLRGFYFPATKIVAIRPFFWPNGAYDQWDGEHAELSADIQMSFIMAIQPALKAQDPGVDFKTNVDNRWLQQTTGRYSW